MSIPYFMAALVFFWTNCISWSPFSQVAHLKVFSQQGLKGAVFPVFRGMLIFVSVLSLCSKRFSTGSSRKLEQERKREIKEDWGRGEKEPPPRNLTILKISSPRNAASDWLVVAVLIEKWKVFSSPLPLPLLPLLWLSFQLARNISIGNACYIDKRYLRYELLYYIAVSFLHFLVLFSVLLLIGENVIGRSETCNITIQNEVRLCLLV